MAKFDYMTREEFDRLARKWGCLETTFYGLDPDGGLSVVEVRKYPRGAAPEAQSSSIGSGDEGGSGYK
jgi:hypothetical protein